MKDENTLKNAFAIRPDILQDTEWDANHPNFSKLGLQLSRSARASKVWMSIQTFGMAAFRAVARGMELAAQADDDARGLHSRRSGRDHHEHLFLDPAQLLSRRV